MGRQAMIWERLKSGDFEAIDRNTPVLVSIAAVEQHGPHLPLDVDCRIGGHFCDRLEEELGDRMLILPQVKVCCSAHHMSFPGTLSVGHFSLHDYLRDMLESVLAHGFRNLLVLNSHGGNQAIGRVLVESMGPKVDAMGGRLAFASWWNVAVERLTELNEAGRAAVGHACEFETSLMLLIDPASVDVSKAPGQCYESFRPWADGDLLRAPPVTVYRSMEAISGGSGVSGDPSSASAEKGRKIASAVVERLVRIVIEFGAP